MMDSRIVLRALRRRRGTSYHEDCAAAQGAGAVIFMAQSERFYAIPYFSNFFRNVKVMLILCQFNLKGAFQQRNVQGEFNLFLIH